MEVSSLRCGGEALSIDFYPTQTQLLEIGAEVSPIRRVDVCSLLRNGVSSPLDQ
jgi:hypothetical protein